MNQSADIVKRLRIVYLVASIFALAILIRAFSIGVVQRKYWIGKKEESSVKTFAVEAIRGNVYSAEGSLLATSLPVYTLRMDLKAEPVRAIFPKKVDSLAYCLSTVFPGKSKETWKRELNKAYSDQSTWFLIGNNIEYDLLQKIRKFPILRNGRYKGGRLEELKSRREMPFRYLAERTLGRYIEGQPAVGIEGAFNESLRGSEGKRLMRKISGGVWRPIEEDDLIEARNGDDVYSTIDIALQDVAESELMNQLNKHKAEFGCAIVMEVETGYIRAIANLGRGKDKDSVWTERFNFAVAQRTEPGSTYKLASLMAAFEDGLASPEDIWDTQGGEVSFCNVKIKDSERNGYGKINLKRAFEVSSNTAIAQAINRAYKSSPEKLISRLQKFHLHEQVQTMLPGEASPVLPDPKLMRQNCTSVPWLAIGYETMISPLQLLTFYNAVANDGKMMRPQFVQEIRRRGEVIRRFDPEVIDPAICSPTTINIVKSMLAGVVERGTASKLKSNFYSVAGKTGTAQIYDPNHGYKDNKRHQASFVGYFPAEKPKYSCIVLISNPTSGAYYAAEVAVPVFKEIADKVYAKSIEMHNASFARNKTKTPNQIRAGYAPEIATAAEKMGIVLSNQNDNAWISAQKSDSAIRVKPIKVQQGIVPDVTGMGLKDALFLLENAGLIVKTYGKGTVRKQSIPSGSRFQKNSQIIIELT